MITLINAEGQICLTMKDPVLGKDNQIHLNVPQLTKGIYLLKIDFNNKTYTKKMVIY